MVLICQPKRLNVTVEERMKLSKRMEIGYITISTVLAIICSPWPFLYHSFGYNLWICWIITVKPSPEDDRCLVIKAGKIATTAFYVATLVAFIFSFCIMVIVQVLAYTQKRVFPYVWVFSSYLVVTLIVIFVTMIINFLNPEDVPSVLHAIKILSVGVMPLIASLVTTIAIVFKIMHLIRCPAGLTHNRIINDGNTSFFPVREDIITYGTSSDDKDTAPWIPPPTSILD